MNWKGQFSSVIAVVMAGVTPVSSQEAMQEIQVQHRVSQTAIFPGDTVLYSLEIESAPEVEILVDDLDISRLNLTGLEPVSYVFERNETGSGTRYEVHYYLTSYEIEMPSLVIGEQSIRYYVKPPGVRDGTAIPENEVIVPASTIGLRSTLPAVPENLDIRDEMASPRISSDITWTGIAGLGLVLFSGLPFAMWSVSRIRRQREISRQRQSHKKQVFVPEVIDELATFDPDKEESRRKGYELLEKIVRDYLAQDMGARAYSLTQSDINEDFPDELHGISRKHLHTVLKECQSARYGKPEYLPTAEQFREDLVVVKGLHKSG